MQIEVFEKSRPTTRLLYTRDDLAEMLSVSNSQIRALEAQGILTSLTLTGRTTGQRYYDHREVMALIDKLKVQAIARRQAKQGKRKPIARRVLGQGDYGS